MYELKVRAVGSSSGVLLPKEMMIELGLKQGDSVFATKAPDGSFRITPFDEGFAEQMKVAEEVASDYRDVLRALAKR
ncbi:AbrB/MazE/SpoVT family DNA-binding domain-containing protein [uncultured Nevskia sp.]|uniref:AbrB/MazE/SpoVT family DNA-binding domain-containing protein n=1 Tax=uncultured Nevskia sp. TaxID=228950 RepID=UPI0025E82737|nr:AbrB/MazE/SpoVT family DNA-binding domain-containing protein [uncultured Nevskia sp.]